MIQPKVFKVILTKHERRRLHTQIKHVIFICGLRLTSILVRGTVKVKSKVNKVVTVLLWKITHTVKKTHAFACAQLTFKRERLKPPLSKAFFD